MLRRVVFSLLLLFSFGINAQEVVQLLPPSWELDLRQGIDQIVLPATDLTEIRRQDSINDLDKGRPYRYGIERPIRLELGENGTWTRLEDGRRIWRVAVRSVGATNISLNFDRFYLPPGGRLFIYNEDRSDLLASFSDSQNREVEQIGSWFVQGETILLEYVEPRSVDSMARLSVPTIIHGYRMGLVDDLARSVRGLNDSGNCQYDVNCPVGDDFDPAKDLLKKTVALLNLGNGYLCTATLINNTLADKRPFLLTADHCLDISNPAFWTARFNWMSPSPVCGTGEASVDMQTNFTLSGAQLLANNPKSDFALVECFDPIPDSWDVAFAGWDNRDLSPEYQVGIHHPKGDIMKVCRDDDAAVQETAGDTEVWLISGGAAGSGDGWELGTTETGSSGSPLFDQAGHLIGQLYGGQSACDGEQTNGQFDLYGRFGVSWDGGNSAEDRLSDWLDPISSGLTTVETLQNILSINDVQFEGELTIYPNPASDYLSVINYRYPQLEYRLHSLLGQQISRGSLAASQSVIPLTSLQEGIYLLELIDGETGQSQTKKIIIQR